MVSALQPRDQRRAALSAGLLASDQDGEVVAAARALCGLLKKGDLDPALVVSAGLLAVAPAPMPTRYPSGFLRPLNERARMARSSPHLNGWERDFLDSVIDRRGLSQRQESALKAILRKAEGVGR